MAVTRIDYQGIIQEIIQPGIVDNIVTPKMDKLNALFTRNTMIKSGSTIQDVNALTETSAGGAFTRADANPPSMTWTNATPYWNKVYYHEKAKVRREDIAENRSDPAAIQNLMQDAIFRATRQLMSNVFSGCIAQIKLDVDDSSDYSDGAITRSVPLQSYEEDTDATITLAYMRGATDAIELKDDIDWREYIWLMEKNVWKAAHPLMSVQGADSAQWIENDPADRIKSGYQPVTSFDTVSVDREFGMTVGDAFLLNRGDVQIQEHFPYEIEEVQEDEFAMTWVVRIGVNCWVRRPRFQAKLTNKD